MIHQKLIGLGTSKVVYPLLSGFGSSFTFLYIYTGWLFVPRPIRSEVRRGCLFYPLNAPEIVRRPVFFHFHSTMSQRQLACFFFRFSCSFCFCFWLRRILSPASSACIFASVFFYVLFHLAMGVYRIIMCSTFNSNATNNHDPFHSVRFLAFSLLFLLQRFNLPCYCLLFHLSCRYLFHFGVGILDFSSFPPPLYYY